MKLKTTLNGQTFAFRDIRDVLAKANEPKAADRLQGVAAETVTERVAAKIVLSELTVGELTNIRQALLPIMAAIGGVLAPIGIYLAFNATNP